MKILVIGPSWVGDMVMSQSLYKAIKANHPECELHVMAPAWCCALLERMPEVDKAITMPLGHGDFKLVARRRLGKQLAAEKYDQAIVQPNSMKSALIPWFARIPVRTGWKGESRYGLLNDLRSNKSAFPLMVEGYLALAYPKEQMKSRADIPTIPHPALHVDLINQSKALERLGLDRARPVLVLCPGAEFGPAKRWPEGHYAVVAQQHLDEGWQVWIFGSNKDVPVANTIRDRVNLLTRPNCHVLAGKTSLHEAIESDGASQPGHLQRLRPDAHRRRPQPAAGGRLWLHFAALHPAAGGSGRDRSHRHRVPPLLQAHLQIRPSQVPDRPGAGAGGRCLQEAGAESVRCPTVCSTTC